MSSYTDSNLTFPQAQQAVHQVAIDLAGSTTASP